MELELPEKPKKEKSLLHQGESIAHQKWEMASDGTFPEITREEIWENLQCSPEDKREITEAYASGLRTVRELSTELGREVRDHKDQVPPQIQQKIFLIVQEAIHLDRPKKEEENSPTHIILNHLGRKNLLRKMTPEQGLALAIEAIRIKDPSAFKKIIFNFKSIPSGKFKNTELLCMKTKTGETLGHLAAKTDFQEAIQYIACNHRNFLEIVDNAGNSLTHTASQWQSGETINYLLGFSKKLFGKKNQEGKTPLDLESGPEICRSIAMQVIEQDVKRAEDILKKSLEACRKIQQKPPQKGIHPAFSSLVTPRLAMETLTLHTKE